MIENTSSQSSDFAIAIYTEKIIALQQFLMYLRSNFLNSDVELISCKCFDDVVPKQKLRQNSAVTRQFKILNPSQDGKPWRKRQ
jgi:hypothetical protein